MNRYEDIDERTFKFAVRVIKMLQTLPRNNVATWKIGGQVIDSSCSVNSNIVQARAGISKKDFRKHMKISLKEARETLRWLELLVAIGLVKKDMMALLIQECDEIVCILVTIIKNSNNSD